MGNKHSKDKQSYNQLGEESDINSGAQSVSSDPGSPVKGGNEGSNLLSASSTEHLASNTSSDDRKSSSSSDHPVIAESRGDQVRQQHSEVGEVVRIMGQNLNKVLDRGENLSDLDQKASALHKGAEQFALNAEKLSKKYKEDNIKSKVALFLTVLSLICLIVAITSYYVYKYFQNFPSPSTVKAPESQGLQVLSDTGRVLVQSSQPTSKILPQGSQALTNADKAQIVFITFTALAVLFLLGALLTYFSYTPKVSTAMKDVSVESKQHKELVS